MVGQLLWSMGQDDLEFWNSRPARLYLKTEQMLTALCPDLKFHETFTNTFLLATYVQLSPDVILLFWVVSLAVL